MIGETILHYKILEKLGEGGMGVVYLAEDTKLGRKVALKFLPQNISSDTEVKARFEIEARAAASLNHPNIATIYSIEETDDQMFISMEYVKGKELKEFVEMGHAPSLQRDEIIKIAIQIAEGLSAAHKESIIHRDIKSSNIMITEDGKIKIMDFGLAKLKGKTKLTKIGSTVGTIDYMSPEQAQGEKVDHRTDIWSFGVVLYEMLTGQMPFRGDYEQAVIYSILNEEPKYGSELQTDIKSLLQKSLARNIEDRYQNVEDLLDDLKAIMSGKQFEYKTKSPGHRSRSYVYLIAGAAIIAAVIYLARYWWPSNQDKQIIDSIAVLPLDNLSGDPNQEYFSDGMTEALITNLSKIHVLKVISRTSVMQYKDTRIPLPEIAKELGVKAVIDGSVMRLGNKVQINAQLIEASTDQNLWAESYERNLTDIFTLQRDIARNIAEQIKATLSLEEKKQLQTASKIDPAAYEAYLKGLYHDTKYNSSDFLKSLDYYETAVEIEPDFTLAYVGIVRACMGLMDIGGLPYNELYPRAKAALDKALQLGNFQAEVYAIEGFFRHVAEWDWDGAEKAFQKSIRLNPNVAQTYYNYASFLISMGKNDEALAAINKSRSLDPLNPGINNDVGWINYCARHYDEAIREYRENIEKYPNFIMSHRELSWVYSAKGMFKEAIQSVQQAVDLEHSSYNLLQLALAYANAGQKNKTYKVLNEIFSRQKKDHLAAYEFALVYTALGNFDKAFEWLEKSRKEHSGWAFFIKTDPAADPLHSDPRYVPFLKRMRVEP